MNNDKIDIVLLWVDGSDREWLKEKNKYSLKKEKDELQNKLMLYLNSETNNNNKINQIIKSR